MSHTPGPWTVLFKAGAYLISVASTEKRRVIAQVVAADEEDAANARLIAKAPEMVAALEEIEAWYQTVDNRDSVPNGAPLFTALRKSRALLASLPAPQANQKGA